MAVNTTGEHHLVCEAELENPAPSNVDNGEVGIPDTGTRDRHQSEKFAAWQLDISQKNFKRSVSSWRKQATQLERLSSDCKDINSLRTARDTLDSKMGEVTEYYEKLSGIEKGVDTFTNYDQVEQDHYQLSKRVSDLIRAIEMDKAETNSRATFRTSASKQSRQSHIEAATEAAALKAKLHFMDIEAAKKMELEQRRVELEKTRTQMELSMAQAKLDAIVKLESEDVKNDVDIDLPTTVKEEYVADYVRKCNNTLPNADTCTNMVSKTSVVSKLNASAPVFTSTTTPLPVSNQTPSVTHPILSHQNPSNLPAPSTYPYFRSPDLLGNVTSNTSSADFGDVLKSFTEQITLSRLPPPEPGVFSGDPLAFPAWNSSFKTLIESKGIPANEQIYYLKKYLGGQAKEAVEGFLLLTTDQAYQEAMTLLEQRFGDPFEVANGFRRKLDSWPKVPPRDGKALRRYADFLKQCEVAMISITSLCVLNDDQENRKMLMKLPDWLTLRWGRVVSGWREKHREFPPFSEFASFVAKEAKIACDPVTSLQSLKPGNHDPVSTTRTANNVAEKRRTPGQSYVTEATSNSNNDSRKKSCGFCKKSHATDDCYSFLAKDLQERKDFAKSKGLCFGCLEQGHLSRDCKNRLKCKTCSKKHPTSLHGDLRKSAESTTEEITTKTAMSHAGINNETPSSRTCKCSMIVPVWLSHSDAPEKEILVYALLDTQSDTTFILDSLCHALDVNGPNTNLSLSTMTSENLTVKTRRIDGLMVRGHNSEMKLALPTTYERGLMPCNRTHIPTPDVAQRWPHLEQIADKLMPLCDAPIGLLIGYNCSRALAPRDVIAPTGDEPYAQRTDLGWGIVGVVHLDQEDNNDPIGVSHRILTHGGVSTNDVVASNFQINVQSVIKEVITPQEVAHMMEMDFNERNSDEQGPSFNDLRFLKQMKEGIHRTDDQHYEMPLPLKDPNYVPPNNKNIAMRRLKQLQTKFHRDPKYKEDYWTFMQKMINNGYAERVSDADLQFEDGLIWYIPHHGVYHSTKPNKIRVVFDCSAKYRGESLNDNLLQGPDLLNKLVGVLCRFRQEKVAFICDIEQMFFQFYVNKEHRNLLRFLWWDPDHPDGQPVEYRMKAHLFGAASSPACANFALRQVATDFEEEFGTDAANFIKNDFYVDDGLKSVASVDEAVKLISDTKLMCQKGGLRLHKFTANNREVISSVPVEDRVQDLQGIDLLHDDLPIERTLGLLWCVQSDTFKFRITLQDRPLTRRGILSTISSIYDPLGFLAPVLLKGKQILQELCRDKADWDSDLPDDLRFRWEQWRSSLRLLETVEVPRCFKPDNFGDVKTAELHHFSDASTSGYGQCTYLRLVDENDNVNCSLVTGKARVTPLKTVTIPRLELTAALVSVRVSAFLNRELKYDNLTNIYWTDSKIILGYLSNDARRFHVFVSNRVQQIRNYTSPKQWRYVKSGENPADEGSRGLDAQDFLSNSIWTKGPAFLWEKGVPSETVDCEIPELEPGDPEIKQARTLATESVETQQPFLNRLDRFSSFISVRRAIGVCLRLTSRKMSNTSYRPCNVEELSRAESVLIRLLQEHAFKQELETLRSETKTTESSIPSKCITKSSPLYRLDPYMDKEGILRVGGRIKHADCTDKLKHPAILPKRHHLTRLIIRHFHEEVHHQGRGITVNAIRSSGYWILGCGSEVSYYISQCQKCRKLRSKAQEQKMADLPEDRVNRAPPFTYCGVDCFGPWYIKEGRKEMKRYGVLFTCMASRAVHIETVNNMTTDSFINCLRRFVAVRGPIRQLRSDQGTNFVGAANELRDLLNKLDHDHIRDFLLPLNCDYFHFKMNTPYSSHMGGVWERQIRTVRSVLASLLDQSGQQLDDECLRTLMCEVMAIINSRPLTTDNMYDGNSPEPLTPNHLLTMKSRVILPPPGTFVREDIYSRKRWRRVQHVANEFWQRWKREYLQTIQLRQKWTRPRRDMRVGDIVIIKDDNLPRNRWSLARVEEIFPDDDGHVRSVKLCLADPTRDGKGRRVNPPTYLNRPIQKLVLLLEAE